MCGIVGIMSENLDKDVNPVTLNRIMDTLKRRGPDESGYYKGNGIFLGHTRLSIIDVSSGQQPMFNEDGSICIVFNGEIFNFQEIKNELITFGHIFKTNSDTEVIIHSYEEWGENCLHKFRGMFAFAIYELVTGKLFIARDRLGIKPLFYSVYRNNFYFASEIKAILQFPAFPKNMDLSALAAYFSLTYIPAPLTIFTHVKKLLPGHYMIINGTNVSTHEYWDISFSEEEKPEAFYIDKIQQLLSDAVSLRLISDVPIGAFLSGGIDSTTIVALMSELSQDPVHTFCMGYGGNTGGFLDEREYAKIVSKKYNTIHEEYEVMPNVNDILDDIVASFDEPFADSSTIPSYYLCKNTREKVTVALSGLGGDELFAGYERYLGFKLSYQFNKLPSFMRKFAGNLILNVPERSDGHYTINHMKRFIRNAHLPGSSRYFGYISNLSEDRFSRLFNYDNRMLEGYLSCKQSIEDRYNNSNASHPLNKVLYTDLKTYLPDDILACTDRISMWHSLEVRVPFLDHKFVELCAQLPIKYKINNFTKKYILKKSFQKQIPEEISKHRKQGFDAPMTNWLRNDLSGLVNNLTNNNIINKLGLFDTNELKNILNEHQDKREIHDKLIWSFIVFNKWYETYMS